MKGFLSDWKQRVVLNGKCSSWMGIQVGVSLGYIPGSLCY